MTSVTTLYQVISEVLGIPADKITTGIRIHDVDTWNSLTHIELVVMIEDKFHVQLTEDEIVSMTSLGALQDILNKRGVLAP